MSTQVSFHSLWKIVKFVLLIQIFNAAMDSLMWVAYDYSIPSTTVATLTIFCTILILTMKIALDREESIPR
ncbi:MAG: hypothetical protein ACLQO7_10605 [Candidatus Bathyarchaeia archaeon]